MTSSISGSWRQIGKTRVWETTTHNEAESRRLAHALARHLRGGDFVALDGEMGTGKTIFVRGLAEAFHVTHLPASPTFPLVQVYRGGAGHPLLCHVDLHRISGREVMELGWEELNDPRTVTVVEWAEKAAVLWPVQVLSIRMSHAGGDARRFEFRLLSPRASELVKKLTEKS